MKRIFYLIILTFCLIGCRHTELVGGVDRDLTVVLTPSFTSTKVLSTAFEDGDRVGVYVVKQGQAMRANFNASDNVLFNYFASNDSLGGVPTPLFYPDKTTPVAIHAYYPYQTGVQNAFRMPFCVTDDIKASDLCYAEPNFRAPSATPLSLTFVHSLSKMVVNVNHSAKVDIAGIIGVSWLAVKDSCYINLATGGLTVSDHHTSDIVANSAFEAILPPQVLAARKLLAIEAKLIGGGTRMFYYNPLSLDLRLEGGKIHTFNLTIRDDNSVALVDDIAIVSWQQGATTATMEHFADNSFTLHWMLPHMDYQKTSSIVFNVRDPRSGYLTPCTVDNMALTTGHSNLAATYTFTLSSSVDKPLSYPYTIESVGFVDNNGDTIQSCKSLIAANVYRSGAITIGVLQDNVLMITTGTLKEWTSRSGSGTVAGGGVSNSFKLQLLEQSYYRDVKSVRLTIDGAKYNFSGISPSAGSNVLIASLSPFDLPDDANRAPAIYPYTIEGVELLNGSGVVVNTSFCNIEVARGGLVTIHIFNGSAFLPTNIVSGWGAATQSGDVDYGGVVNTNPISLIYCNGLQAAKCDKVTQMTLTIGDKEVVFPVATMSGNKFAAGTVSAVDIISPSVSGTKPTNYPYVVTHVKLYAGASLIEDVDAAIKVVGSGALTIQIMK